MESGAKKELPYLLTQINGKDQHVTDQAAIFSSFFVHESFFRSQSPSVFHF
jgi:hypothetical protein